MVAKKDIGAFGIFLKLLEVYKNWDGHNFDEFYKFFEHYEKSTNFNSALRRFHYFINNDEAFNKHLFRREKQKLFLDAYWVKTTPEFKQLNKIIGSYLSDSNRQHLSELAESFWQAAFVATKYVAQRPLSIALSMLYMSKSAHAEAIKNNEVTSQKTPNSLTKPSQQSIPYTFPFWESNYAMRDDQCEWQENFSEPVAFAVTNFLENTFPKIDKNATTLAFALIKKRLQQQAGVNLELNQVSISDMSEILAEIRERFIKTEVSEEQFYFSGDFAITPDGKMILLPDLRYSLFDIHEGEFLPASLLIHREEFLSLDSLEEKVTTYLQAQLGKYEALTRVYVHLSYFDYGEKDVKDRGKKLDKLAYREKLLKLFSYADAYNLATDENAEILQQFNFHYLRKGRHDDKDDLRFKKSVETIIKNRLEHTLANVRSLLEKVQGFIDKNPIPLEEKNLRLQMMTAFNDQKNYPHTSAYLQLLANNPQFKVIALPHEGSLKNIDTFDRGRGDMTGGVAYAEQNRIMIRGFDHIETVPGVFINLQVTPLPSVFGGVYFWDGNTNEIHHSHAAQDLTHSITLIANQETHDFVHSVLANGTDMLKIFEGDATHLDDFKEAVMKTHVRTIKMEILANKIINGVPLSDKTTNRISKKDFECSRLYKEDISNLVKVSGVRFNEIEEWEKFKQCFKQDFSSTQATLRSYYVRMDESENYNIGQTINIEDPLLLKQFSSVVVDRGKSVAGKVYVGVALPKIEEEELKFACILRELAVNTVHNVVSLGYLKDKYRYDLLFEIIGRMGELPNKFKSAADLVLLYLKPTMDYLNDRVKKAVVEQFIENLERGENLELIEEKDEAAALKFN